MYTKQEQEGGEVDASEEKESRWWQKGKTRLLGFNMTRAQLHEPENPQQVLHNPNLLILTQTKSKPISPKTLHCE